LPILFVEKIHKTVATRAALLAQIFSRSLYGWGFAPDHTRGAYSAPRSLAVLGEGVGPRERGKGREGKEKREGRGKKREGRSRRKEWREGKGKKREGRGKGGGGRVLFETFLRPCRLR